MKKLDDYKDELHRCSKCGLCQSVCPLYKELKNECAVSRGQFILLNGVVKNELKINKNINKYLDICLKCNKCSEFCPSEINVFDIITAAKYEYFKKSLSGKIYSILESKFIFDTFLNIIGALTKILHPQKKQKQLKKKAIYFSGCIGKFSPAITNYITDILNKHNIELIYKDFGCCGMPFLTTGNLKRFIEQAEENIAKIDDNIDYFIMDCSSCEFSWKEYPKYIENNELLEKYNNIKFKNLYELIDELEIKFTAKHQKMVSYHKPCHETHEENILNIISKCRNVEYIELDSKNDCCAFASLEHPNTIKSTLPIIKKKRKSILNSKTDTVLTSCVGCLGMLSISTLFKKRINRVISFIKNNCEIL